MKFSVQVSLSQGNFRCNQQPQAGFYQDRTPVKACECAAAWLGFRRDQKSLDGKAVTVTTKGGIKLQMSLPSREQNFSV